MLGIAARTARLAALVGLIAGGLAFLPPSPVSAGGTVLTVTTTADVVDDEDGLLSLREAARQADEGGVSTIVLADGATYVLDHCTGVNEQGVLFIEPPGSVTLDGNGSTIEQTCEDVGVIEAGDLVLDDLTLHSTATQPGTLVDVAGGHLAVEGVTVTGPYGNISAVIARTLEIADSSFDGVEQVGVAGAMIWGWEEVVIADTTITDSTVDSAIQGGVHATNVDIVGNTFADQLMIPINELVLDGVTVRDNDGMPAGMVLAGADWEWLEVPVVEPFVVTDSVFVGNTMGPNPLQGVECCPILGFGDVDAEVSGTSVVGNTGFRFDIATYVNEQEVPPHDLLVENSTISLNTGPLGDGVDHGSTAIRGRDEAELRHVTVATNNHLDGWAEVVAPALFSFGSIVVSDGDARDVGSAASDGGNLGSDSSCGFDQANDRPSEVDPSGYAVPELTAAMPVWLPTAQAEGVDLIAAEDCLPALALDQIGRERPQGSGCDAGAVELLQPFSDVGPGHPFFEDISWASSEGIAGGFEDGTFRPGLPVSRQAMAAFLYRLAGEPVVSVPAPPSFSDVSASHPFSTEIEWLAGEGIAGGFGNGTFRPSLPVSRQAMAAFLYRRAGEPPFAPPSPPTFDDVGPANPFRTEIEWLVQEGIADGYDDGTFRPGVAVSRQAMAAFLHRIASD